MKLLDPRKGWKTYAVCAIGLILGLMQADHIQIPTWADWALTFLGLGTLRMGVQKQSAQLAETILAAITTPDPNTDTTGATVKDAPVEVHVLQPAK